MSTAVTLPAEGNSRSRFINRDCARESTTANYFSCPKQKRDFGYRLDNTEILSSGFGAVSRPAMSSAA
jgi:hypothetical protein